MDLKKLQTFEGLIPPSQVQPQQRLKTEGPSFKEIFENATPPTAISEGFLETQKIGNSSLGSDGVKFSNHAIDRMQSRGISFQPEDVRKLNEAVGKAAAKGSKDTLVLMNDAALIVSVKNKTVVTVMDKAALKENVFTNIDSTIVM